jgi:hypothetical protein
MCQAITTAAEAIKTFIGLFPGLPAAGHEHQRRPRY